MFGKTPKIAFVFSGGGARGISQIGALKVLEDLGIRPDIVIGTSIGSVIGGLYAIGYSADEIEELFLSQNWNDLFLDNISRKNISIEEKNDFGNYIIELPIVKKKISLPKGLIAGQKISILLTKLTTAVSHISDFDDFNIPFRCAATNLETGNSVVFEEGNLAEAMRASMSIPSIFVPFKIDGTLYIDGGISGNIQSQTAREMGADIIIAIDSGSKLNTKEELNSLLKIIEQTINFRGLEKTIAQRELCDLIITPELDHFGITSFNNIDSLIVAGEKAANLHIKELKIIAEKCKKNNQTPIPILKIDSFLVKDIKYRGLKTVSKNLVIGKSLLKKNSIITIKEIENAIERLYGSQFFESVIYKLEPVEGGVKLFIELQETTTDYLKIGGRFDDDLKSALHFNLLLRNKIFEGSRISTKLRLSQNPHFEFSYFFHTGWKPGFGLGEKISFQQISLSSYIEDNVRARYSLKDLSSESIIQTVFNNSLTLGAGFRFSRILINPSVGDIDFEFDVNSMAGLLFFEYDSLDDEYFPFSGKKISLRNDYFFNVNDNTKRVIYNPHFRVVAQVSNVITFFKYLTASASIAFGGIDEDAINVPPHNLIYVGGTNQIKSNSFIFPSKSFLQMSGRLAQGHSFYLRTNLPKSFFLKFGFHIAETADSISDFTDFENYLFSHSMSIQRKTIIGPISFMLSKNTADKIIHSSFTIGFKF